MEQLSGFAQLGAGIAIGFGAIGAGIGVGIATKGFLEAISRQPSISTMAITFFFKIYLTDAIFLKLPLKTIGH